MRTEALSLAWQALDVRDEAQNPIATWLDLLEAWNKRIDLTAARTDEELIDLMLADAAFLAGKDAAIPEGARVVDVGTGAGAPGLALALLRPDLKITLVEPLTKRISFLRTVIGTLGRTDIVLLRERAEDLLKKEELVGSWDVAISRATLAPEKWIPIGLKLASVTWALLAREEPPEIPDATVEATRTYVWPLTKVERRAASYRRST